MLKCTNYNCLVKNGPQVVLLAQHDREPAPGGVARDAGTIDSAADDQQIDGLAVSHALPSLPCILAQ